MPKDPVAEIRSGVRDVFMSEPAVQVLRGMDRLGGWVQNKYREGSREVKRLARKTALKNLFDAPPKEKK